MTFFWCGWQMTLSYIHITAFLDVTIPIEIKFVPGIASACQGTVTCCSSWL